MLLVRGSSGVPQYTRGIRWFIGFPWTWWNNERKRARRKRDGIIGRRKGKTDERNRVERNCKREKEGNGVVDYRLRRRLVYGSADAHHLFERTCCSRCVQLPSCRSFAYTGQSIATAKSTVPSPFVFIVSNSEKSH